MQNEHIAEAFVASYNHARTVLYKSRYQNLGILGVTTYPAGYTASEFKQEFTAFETEMPDSVIDAVEQTAHAPHKLTIFHDEPVPEESLIFAYDEQGYHYQYTRPIRGMTLPNPLEISEITIRKVNSAADIDYINRTFKDELPLPVSAVNAPEVVTFFAEDGLKAVGMAQMVTVLPDIAYIAQMYTLEAYRNKGMARTLLNRIHREAYVYGKQKVIVAPPADASDYYQQYGYDEVWMSFSVFMPEDE